MLKKRSLLTVLLSSFALLVLALVLIISAVPDSTAKAAEIEGMKGSGTYSDPYRIEEANDLVTFSKNVKNGNSFNGKYVFLINDVDMSGITSWVPIGTSSTAFDGTFDGNGRTLTGFTISDDSLDRAGLFGENSGIVKNLFLSGSVKGNENVAGIVARNHNGGQITNCTFSGTVQGRAYVGGIAGYNDGMIENCFNEAAVTCNEKGGGIAGVSNRDIVSCTNKGEIKGNKYIGGIAGKCENGTVTGCLNETYASVTSLSSGGDTYAGGIAGEAKGEILYSTNKAGVTCSGQCAGGIAGFGSSLNISECINEGNVNSNGNERTGGIAGAVSSNKDNTVGIVRCTNRGTVSGGSKTGGIAGSAGYCNIENCISNKPVSGGERTGGIAGELAHGSGIDACTNTGKVTGSKYVGGIAGIQDHSEDVLNSINSGDVKGSGDRIGGITGHAVFDYKGGVGSSRIRYCTNKGDVEGLAMTGGIAGFSNANISNNINRGDVTGTNYTAGIVGETFDGGDTLQVNINEGDISGNERVGGICGYQRSSAIVQCYNKGNVKGSQDVGGIIGFNEPVDVGCTIKYCINDGDVTATGPQDSETTAGGIVGYGNEVSVIECGNTGDIEGNGTHIGGVVGFTKGGSITDSYNRGAVFGYRYVGGILGRARDTVTITRCYCFAPDDHPKYSGKDGVDCLYYQAGNYGFAGGLVGGRWNSGVVVNLNNNYWWCDCSDYALGWVESFGILSGDGYDYFYYQSRFKDSSNFKGWDFDKVWVVKGDAPVNRRAQNINPKGGVGGVGGAGGNGATVLAYTSRVYINNESELRSFRDSVNGGNSYSGVDVFLKSDLDFSGTNWTPVGSSSEATFSGTFYGEGHVIKGIKVDSSSNAGLFGHINYGSVRDLWVYGSVKGGGYNVGGIAGYCSGSIENCVFIGDVTSTATEGNVGGICGGYGTYSASGSISDCLHVGSVSGSGITAGGIVGNKSFIGFTVERCLQIGKVTGSGNKVGAIAGNGTQMGRVGQCFAASGSADNLFGNYNNIGGDPYSCAFLTAEQLIDPASFQNVYASRWNIGFEAGHVWGIGWEYPLPQQFSNYITLVPLNDKDDARIVWLPRTEMKVPSAAYTRDGYAFDSWNTERDGSGTKYVSGDTVPANTVLYGQWNTVDYTIIYTDTGDVQHYNIESTDLLAARQRDHYSFDGWKVTGADGNWASGEIVAGGELLTGRFGNVRLSDTWSALPKYTVTWKMDDGKLIDKTLVEDGALPEHDDPVKPETAEFTYTFTGWSPDIAAVQGDTEYTATFSEVRRSYTITWKNDDGSVIDTTTVEYGTVPAHADAVKDNTAEFTYTFAGWSPALASVSGDTEYTATFSSTKNSYTVTWKNDDGSVIDTTTVEYGTVPTHADAVKDNTAEFTYTFAGWSPALASVSGDTEYTATFSSTKNSYTVTWKNDDGSVIDTTTVEYGTVPTHADAVKDNTAEFTYTFAGWSPEPAAVTGTAEYTAVFVNTKNSYKVTWKNDDGSVIDTTTAEYGTVPEHEPPVKDNTAEFTYTFEGWEPEVVSVTGEAVYTAKFTAERNSYTVTWLDDDGSVIDTQTVEYGQTPEHADMAKAGDAYNTYAFTGWSPEITAVTGEASYTAVYTATKNAYEIKDAENLSWTKGSGETVTVTAIQTGAEDRSFDDFAAVEIDGNALENGVDYTAVKGSTVVTISADALERLEKGSHTLIIKFIGGEASTALEIIEKVVEPIPQTGDVNVSLIVVLGVLCVAAFALMLIRSKKRAH